MHRRHVIFRPVARAALAAAAFLFAAGVLLAPVASAARGATKVPPARASSNARAAAGWLGRQFGANGDLPRTGGEAGINTLPLAVVALEAARVGERQIEAGIGYLERNFRTFVEVRGAGGKEVPDPGRLAEVILAAVAAKVSSRHFGGRKGVDDLVARLLATQQRTGADAGLFGSPEAPVYASAYTQGLALAALAAVGRRSRSGAEWLVAQQCKDGGWESYRSGSAPCPAPDAKDFAGPDTNDTALAIEGLVASRVTPKLSPLQFLRASQYPSGGFAYYGVRSSAQSPDPDSTAEVAQALVALHKLSSVLRDGRNAVEALSGFQLRCGAPPAERGAFRYPGEPGDNLLATAQAVPALMREPYPVGPGTTSRSLPVLSCS